MKQLENTKEQQLKKKNFLKIKWELIITIFVTICVFLTLNIYYKYDNWDSLLLVMIFMCLLCALLGFYDSIRQFRLDLFKNGR